MGDVGPGSKQTSRLARVKHQVDSLNREVDSLKKYKQLIQTDPVTQEKIAREEFGMVRGNKEMLYRYTEPDSAAGNRKRKSRRRVDRRIVVTEDR